MRHIKRIYCGEGPDNQSGNRPDELLSFAHRAGKLLRQRHLVKGYIKRAPAEAEVKTDSHGGGCISVVWSSFSAVDVEPVKLDDIWLPRPCTASGMVEAPRFTRI